MQHASAQVTRARRDPAPIWVLVAGIVALLIALGPSLVTPATTSPARTQAATATATRAARP